MLYYISTRDEHRLKKMRTKFEAVRDDRIDETESSKNYQSKYEHEIFGEHNFSLIK